MKEDDIEEERRKNREWKEDEMTKKAEVENIKSAGRNKGSEES